MGRFFEFLSLPVLLLFALLLLVALAGTAYARCGSGAGLFHFGERRQARVENRLERRDVRRSSRASCSTQTVTQTTRVRVFGAPLLMFRNAGDCNQPPAEMIAPPKK